MKGMRKAGILFREDDVENQFLATLCGFVDVIGFKCKRKRMNLICGDKTVLTLTCIV